MAAEAGPTVVVASPGQATPPYLFYGALALAVFFFLPAVIAWVARQLASIVGGVRGVGRAVGQLPTETILAVGGVPVASGADLDVQRATLARLAYDNDRLEASLT